MDNARLASPSGLMLVRTWKGEGSIRSTEASMSVQEELGARTGGIEDDSVIHHLHLSFSIPPFEEKTIGPFTLSF
jgi:hypothetical protein